MKSITIFLLVATVFTGCASRSEQQHAADAIEAQKAIVQIQAPLVTNPDPIVSKAATDTTLVAQSTIPRIENAVSTPAKDLPQPTVTAPIIAQDAPKWAAANPPPPAPTSNGAFWAAAASTGLIALYGLKRAAPLVPGLGPTVGTVADMVWQALAHRDQKAADEAQAKAANAAALIAPALAAIANSSTLDPALRKYITPEVLAAASALAVDAGPAKI